MIENKDDLQNNIAQLIVQKTSDSANTPEVQIVIEECGDGYVTLTSSMIYNEIWDLYKNKVAEHRVKEIISPDDSIIKEIVDYFKERLGVMKESCSRCKYWKKFEIFDGKDLSNEGKALMKKFKAVGGCRRFPPQAHLHFGVYQQPSFPEVEWDEWCGEFKEMT